MGKRLGLWLLSAVFTICVLFVPGLVATNLVFGSSEAIKKSLSDSGFYGSATTALIDQAIKMTSKPPEARSPDEIPLDPAVTKDIAARVITPTKLQTYSEQVVDGTYNWLEGKTEKPDFMLDLATLKQDLGNATGDAAVQRVQSLPPCTLAQLQQLNPEEANPFTLPCQPPGIDLQAERAKLVTQITTDPELMKDSTITAEDAKTDQSGQNPFDNLAFVPTVFQWSKVWPWVLGVLGVLAAAAYIYFNDDRRKGVKRISKTLLISGILLAIGVGIGSFVFSSFGANPEGNAEATGLHTAIFDAVRTLNAAFNRILLVFAVTYVVLGIAGLIWVKLRMPAEASDAHAEPKEAHHKDEAEPEPAEHKKSEKPETKPDPEKPKKVSG